MSTAAQDEWISHIEHDRERAKIFVWLGEEVLYSIHLATYDSKKTKNENLEFIAAAINEKIEREKGEREDGFLKALDEIIESKGKLTSLSFVRDLYLSTLTKK